jgi:hypothetical protein
MKALWLTAAILLTSNLALASTRICVSVQQRSWYKTAPGAPATATSAQAAAPAMQGQAPAPGSAKVSAPTPFAAQVQAEAQAQAQEQAEAAASASATADGDAVAKARAKKHEIDPHRYLERMLEYEISHEPGFSAVKDSCQQQLSVELYPLDHGWTVFARYSGTEREEKVDRAELDEFAELAQRIAFSLLRSRPITHTITRENVLRSDSEVNLRTINGTSHLVFGMGTQARLARLATAQGATEAAAVETRILTPVSVQLGYRRKLRAWGLDAFTRLNLGTENTGVHHNDLGGHVDYQWSLLAGLHFLHYMDAPGINSFYFGGGAAFELAFFGAIRPIEGRSLDSRDTLMGGGLNIDVLAGYEFMRASSVHFFGQIELNAPTYLVNTENDSGAINTYMPSALAQIGIIF